MRVTQPSLFSSEIVEEEKQPEELVLREYQKAAVDKILWSQQLEGNDLCVLPTGAGKSVVIAYLAVKLNKPILILQPSKEILEQNYKKLLKYVPPQDVGIYSASLDSRVIRFFTFATIQSIYQKPELFRQFGIVIIDECHLVNPKNLSGMFTSFLRAIGNPKVIGFTATPYRLTTVYRRVKSEWGDYDDLVATAGIKLVNRIKERFWSRLIFNINNAELLEQGYLCPLNYIDQSVIKHEEIPVNKSLSDFDLEAYEEQLKNRMQKIKAAIAHASEIAKHVLVFCSSVKQAEMLQLETPESAVITGKTNKFTRENIIKNFTNGTTKVVFNVGVLTTGFDHPALDCIVLLRPTKSIALYYQMLGRGVRIAPGKDYCNVIDLTSTVKTLGRVETIKLEKLEGKWELVSETGSWHNQPLYSYRIELRKEGEHGRN